MVNYGFVLLPLYIWPVADSTWQPLIDAANQNPQVDFTVIVNPDNGPSTTACPSGNYVSAVASLNAVPNINLLGYVHTADKYTCNTICSCSAPLSDLEANVTLYANWPSACNIHVDGIFIDEAPSDASCLSYMTNATDFVKSSLKGNNTVIFNPGAATDSSYFGVADYINVFENTEAAYDTVNVGSLDGNGQFSRQSTFLIYDYTDGTTTLQRDVTTILSFAQDSIAGLYITDQDGYTQFPTIWETFVGDVATVVKSNMASGS